MLYVASCGVKGRGVFSDSTILSGEIIECCPVLEISAEDLVKIHSTKLYHYYFCWDPTSENGALALGLGSIYNHSYTPNTIYVPDIDERMIRFRSIRKILANEEITINYNGSPNDRSPLWANDKMTWVD
ncbi:hypothetical protein CI610_00658 [invertebrate metagenome]|uniref:SET domain-containing protein n=1 Tax=invertebrate metagenome TaxID=1711999 RepID=A0A2H9TAU4_9ZZZZ